MGDFITNVRMEGNFDDAELDSDDIRYSPRSKDLEEKIRINGKITGPVEIWWPETWLLNLAGMLYLNGNVTCVVYRISTEHSLILKQRISAPLMQCHCHHPAIENRKHPRLDKIELPPL